MKLKQLFEDDDAVSPVIGVILMVAITVILAAVIATFVLGLGEQVQDVAPSTSFSAELDTNADEYDDWNVNASGTGDGILEIRHSGGPTIDAGTLSVIGSSASEGSNTTGGPLVDGKWNASDTLSAGDTISLWVEDGDRIEIIWESNGDSARLATFEVS